jgi:hypothetical protein
LQDFAEYEKSEWRHGKEIPERVNQVHTDPEGNDETHQSHDIQNHQEAPEVESSDIGM